MTKPEALEIPIVSVDPDPWLLPESFEYFKEQHLHLVELCKEESGHFLNYYFPVKTLEWQILAYYYIRSHSSRIHLQKLDIHAVPNNSISFPQLLTGIRRCNTYKRWAVKALPADNFGFRKMGAAVPPTVGFKNYSCRTRYFSDSTVGGDTVKSFIFAVTFKLELSLMDSLQRNSLESSDLHSPNGVLVKNPVGPSTGGHQSAGDQQLLSNDLKHLEEIVRLRPLERLRAKSSITPGWKNRKYWAEELDSQLNRIIDKQDNDLCAPLPEIVPEHRQNRKRRCGGVSRCLRRCLRRCHRHEYDFLFHADQIRL